MRAYKLTLEEYIRQEVETDTKYEYHDGRISAMAGGTLAHGIICGNIYSALRNLLKGDKAGCFPFNSEIKLAVEKANAYVYPDCMVVCREVSTAADTPNAITNPILIVEVLLKSTAGYDRGDKFHLYRKIPSFKEYVLIDQSKYVVDVHYKHKDSDLWRITRYEGRTERILLQSIGVEIQMEDLYYQVGIKE